MTPQHPQTSKNLIVGLSGPSSSGKTTLARLLRAIFNIPASAQTNHNSITLFILHEDDFYKTDAEIPLTTNPLTHRQLQDWDCAAALDLPLLERTLKFVHEHGRLPPDLQSKEDQNDVGESGVSEEDVEWYRREIIDSVSRPPTINTPSSAARGGGGGGGEGEGKGVEVRICILDGFLLYPDPSPQASTPSIPLSITSLFSLKLFLRSTRAQTLSRRSARTGYVTLEGFWADPPGYVEEVVWPSYVREHAWMFEDGNVDEGAVRGSVVEGEDGGIRVGPGRGERDVGELLGWGVGVLGDRVGREIWEEGLIRTEGRGG